MEDMSWEDGLAKLEQAAADLAEAASALSEAAQIVANVLSGRSDNAPKEHLEGFGGTSISRDCLNVPVMTVGPYPSIANRPEIATGDPVRPYHILVDYETDVLVYACALIQNSNRTICYTHHSVSALHLYATLLITEVTPKFRSVNSKLVYTIENTTQEELDRVCSLFLGAENSLLLVPETVYPNVRLPDSDSWVIHVGWPVDILTYIQHIQDHKAFNNVFIAQPDDRRGHGSVACIMRQSIPWPGNLDSIMKTASAIRTTLKQKLLEVPVELKENAYLDYIACHGPHGHRNWSWEASRLAYYANSYLLDILQYTSPENDRAKKIEMLFSPPEISPEFVKRHRLEKAVHDGVIRVKEVDSELNRMTSLPEEYAAVMEKETETAVPTVGEHLPQPHSLQEPYHSSAHIIEPEMETQGRVNSWPLSSLELMPSENRYFSQGPSLEFNPWTHSADNTPPRADSPSIIPQRSLARQYLIIEAEFDIIPAVSYLARQGSVSRTICFVKCLNATEALIEPLKKILPKPWTIHAVRVGPLTKPVKKTLQSGSECLIFCDIYHHVHPELINEGFDSVIHVGWPENDNIYTNQTQSIGLRTNHVILSRKELNENGSSISPELHRMGVSPVDPDIKRNFNRQTELSTISSERTLWRETITSLSSAAHEWIIHHFSGIHKKREWTSIDVVNNANRHVKEVLLYGYGRQGNAAPGGPVVTAEFVAHFKLEDAVMVGVLTTRDCFPII